MHELIRIDSSITSLTALRNAMYRMSGDLGLVCRMEANSYIVESTEIVGDDAMKLFLRHINDYQLREIVSEKTTDMRDAILGAALLRLTEHEGDK